MQRICQLASTEWNVKMNKTHGDAKMRIFGLSSMHSVLACILILIVGSLTMLSFGLFDNAPSDQPVAEHRPQSRTAILPVLYDHHSHTSLYIALLNAVDFSEVRDKVEAERIIGRLPHDKVTLIKGWHKSRFAFSDSELASMPPVIIVHYSLHTIRMSKQAETMLRDAYPVIVAKYHDAEWYERHIDTMLSFIGGIPESNMHMVHQHLDEINSKGIFGVEDMLLVNEDILKLILAHPMGERIKFWVDPESYRRLSAQSVGKIHGIKVFVDGGLTPKTAALKKPYRNEKTQGILCYKDDELLAIMRSVAERDLPIAMHAVGDLAVDQIIRVARVLKSERMWFPSIRIEHAQFISLQQARDVKEAGIILSMQPVFSEDSTTLADILPEGYPPINNPFRMLIDEVGFIPGTDLLFGSDGMPHGVEASLQAALFPPYTNQRVSLEEFVQGYTRSGELRTMVVEIDDTNKHVRLVAIKE